MIDANLSAPFSGHGRGRGGGAHAACSFPAELVWLAHAAEGWRAAGRSWIYARLPKPLAKRGADVHARARKRDSCSAIRSRSVHILAPGRTVQVLNCQPDEVAEIKLLEISTPGDKLLKQSGRVQPQDALHVETLDTRKDAPHGRARKHDGPNPEPVRAAQRS